MRWFRWCWSIVPFLLVVGSWLVGLSGATSRSPSLPLISLPGSLFTKGARLTYQFGYIIKGVGMEGTPPRPSAGGLTTQRLTWLRRRSSEC